MRKITVLVGMRQNCMLSYRPNLRTGTMERCDTQSWCKAEELVREGSHRIKSSWAQNRYSWLGLRFMRDVLDSLLRLSFEALDF